MFARITSEENGLPQFMEHEIVFTIKKQLQNYYAVSRDEIKDRKEHIKKIDINVYVDDMYFKDCFLWDVLDESICPE